MEQEKKIKLMIRCPKCGRENYSICVYGAICYWCGYNGQDDPEFKSQ